MRVDIYKLELEQARRGKSWKELGVDRRLIKRAKDGRITPRGVTTIANALGVDPEEITTRE